CLAHDTSSMLLTDRAPRHESETAARARKPAASLAILVRADIGRTARTHVDRLCLIAPVVSVLTRLGLAQGYSVSFRRYGHSSGCVNSLTRG
ncbi:MAG: hypothetical protein QOD29_1577, partial [Alphaproteobacteria bacterium]|nr:hypothetical protein [Alphaproteobacteria bacterium]